MKSIICTPVVLSGRAFVADAAEHNVTVDTVQTEHPVASSRSKSTVGPALRVAIGALFIVVILACVVVYYIRRRRRRVTFDTNAETDIPTAETEYVSIIPEAMNVSKAATDSTSPPGATQPSHNRSGANPSGPQTNAEAGPSTIRQRIDPYIVSEPSSPGHNARPLQTAMDSIPPPKMTRSANPSGSQTNAEAGPSTIRQRSNHHLVSKPSSSPRHVTFQKSAADSKSPSKAPQATHNRPSANPSGSQTNAEAGPSTRRQKSDNYKVAEPSSSGRNTTPQENRPLRILDANNTHEQGDAGGSSSSKA